MSMANRRPWLGWGILALGFGFLYLPILLLMLYSFNSSRLATVWAGFSAATTSRTSCGMTAALASA